MSNYILAIETKKGITLTLDKLSFAPLTNIHGNQLSVSVRYQVDDESLVDEKINGLLKALIHCSSFPEGFVAKSKGGVEELKTTIRDPILDQVITNVTFTNLKKTETLSNTLTAKLNLTDSASQTETIQ